MNTNDFNTTSAGQLKQIVSVLWTYRGYWMAPMIAGMILAGLYVFGLRGETWSAKQSLMVRDDLLGQSYKPGRFESLESMKSAQETILEVARNAQVIRNALTNLGPPLPGMWGSKNEGAWPSEEVIEDVQGSITISAPNGAEFGKTEIVVLHTKASGRQRSRQFISFLMNEIIAKASEVRLERLQSMEVELVQARDAAVIGLDESKDKLREMDEQLGSDVSVMNSLNSTQSGDTSLSREIVSIRAEKRVIEARLETANLLLAMLQAAQEKPEQLISISAELITYQPHLGLLKTELVQTQRELANARGRYYAKHPVVMQANDAYEEMKKQIYAELGVSIRGFMNDIEVIENKSRRLDLDIAQLNHRLTNLSGLRADSLTLLAEVKTRSELANKTQTDLSAIQALTTTALNVDLLSRVDEPQVSTRPDGLGKKSVIMAGGVGGLMIGLGVVMLIAPPLKTGSTSVSLERRVVQSDVDPRKAERPKMPVDSQADLKESIQGLVRQNPNVRPIDLVRSSEKESRPIAIRPASKGSDSNNSQEADDARLSEPDQQSDGSLSFIQSERRATKPVRRR